MRRGTETGSEGDDKVSMLLKEIGKLLVWQRASTLTKSDVIIELAEMGFGATRIAELIGWKPKDVTSVLSKNRKRMS